MSTTTDDIRKHHRNAIQNATQHLVVDHWIDGESRGAESGERFEVRDPAVDDPITEVTRGGADDVDAAVTAARNAFGSWSRLTPIERDKIIREWTATLRDHVDELVLLESLDTGKPLTHARSEITKAFDYFEYYASVAQAHEGNELPQGPDNHTYVRREPFGVTGQIIPWNYPLALFAWKAGPALAAGNTVVTKPSEEAPLSVTRVAQLSEGLLPDGVVNIVNGYGEETGAPLTAHERVDKLSFTGSVPVGQQVMAAAAEDITPVTLELGGKSPFIVFPDADLEQAAATSAAGLFYNAGQSCDACTRVLVHEDIHDDFLDRYVDEAKNAWQPGDPLAEGTTMGPLAFGNQFEKTSDYVDLGRQEGAKLVCGGEAPADDAFGDGWFFQPTVFDEVDNDMRIAQEEIFGPIQSIITFSDYEEAIDLANDSQYGLAAGVATQNASVAHRAAADIQAGSIWINEYHGTDPGVPFGGYKRSGIGRECAKEALDEYTQLKAVNVSLDKPHW